MKTRSLPKPVAANKTAPAPAPKSAVRRPSKKGSSDGATTATTNTSGLNGQSDQVISSLDQNVTVTSSPQEDQIAARAYQIWLENGRPEGRDEENWLQAQRELASSTAPVG
ncbi:MAG: DUF2934 domain-containing protein [Prosthecobacter sp.]